MGRKLCIIFSCLFCLYLFNTNLMQIYAETNVKECLETGKDCLEEFDQQQLDNIQENEDDAVVESTNSPSIVFNFVKMIFALLLVLALIYFILTIIKKRNKLHMNNNVLDNLGGISVGQNKSIQLVRIGDKVYIIGVGDNVEMLQELTDEEIKDTLFQQQEKENETVSFLQNVFKKNNSSSTEDMAAKENANFTASLQHELNKLKENRTTMIDKYREKDD
ncbi:flagellar biosynthetic protein FliO [Pseudogracilibacillus sp. SE30717A]|uniref:flagellar biosynthetic protein FliO n=1 Tax=Pseudogracilibacillus sp. SE30717A TaxID=3098293 RepID=UPI00300E227E